MPQKRLTWSSGDPFLRRISAKHEGNVYNNIILMSPADYSNIKDIGLNRYAVLSDPLLCTGAVHDLPTAAQARGFSGVGNRSICMSATDEAEHYRKGLRAGWISNFEKLDSLMEEQHA